MDGPEQPLSRAKDYQKKKQVLTLVHLVWTPVVLGLMILTPFSHLLKQTAVAIAAQPYLTAALYTLLFILFLSLADFPFTVYSGFVLEHRFQLSNETFAAWLKDYAKKMALSTGFTILLILGLYALIWNFPFHWWLAAWAGYALVSYGLGKIFPVWIVPLFYKYGKVESEGLKKRILNLASRYGMPVENVYSINLSKTTKKANAAFMGMGRTKRVVLSDTLLDSFTEDEIETVVAHELGHFKHRDIWKQLGFGLLVSFLTFRIAFLAMEPAAKALGFDGAGDIGSLPLLFLFFFFFTLFLMPLQNGFSRWMERAADRFALTAFPYPKVFISCMEKLGRVNLADPDPNPVFEWIFYDHPSIGKRIRMAKALLAILLCLAISLPPAMAEEKSDAAKTIEERQRVEMLGFFLKDPKKAALPKTGLSIEFYNQAVQYYQAQEYRLARQALQDSLKQDPQNSLAYELLGDVDYLEQDLKAAKANYEIASNLKPRDGLKEKIEKISKENVVEKKLATYRELHFIIKYHDEERAFEGFELRELLRSTYRSISQDFAYYFKHQVVVLLYDEDEFKQIVNAPHWAAGVYDGKVRMPAYQKGFGQKELRALTAHEVTHAFVTAMSGGRAPSWINEGLAEYEENKVKEVDQIVFESAVKTKTLLPLDELMSQGHSDSLSKDPLLVSLFYQQSFHLVRYLIDRYSMFHMKQILSEYAEGKNSDEAIRSVFKISTNQLEKEWKTTFSK